MKVGIEIAKTVCKHNIGVFERQPLRENSKWHLLVRFRLMIYVPGILWKSRREVDFALPKAFDLGNMIREVIKLLHVCMDHRGDLSRHNVDPQASIELSHVLCGPIADPPIDTELNQEAPTLRELLKALRDNKANADSNKFSLEQAVILPTAMLACLHDGEQINKYRHAGGEQIQTLQNMHVDGLALSGAAYLSTLEKIFESLGVWEGFMKPHNMSLAAEAAELVARDVTSGNYGDFNWRNGMTDAARASVALGEDGVWV
jgi:hypothetical protein